MVRSQSNSSCSFLIYNESSLLSGRSIPLRQPFRCLNQLNHIDELLPCHHWCANTCEDPRDSTIHLIGASHFERSSTPWIREKCAHLRVDRRSGLNRGNFVVLRREQRGTENWAGEGEKVEGDEEELI
jgi:hypothetical protein